MNLNENDFNGRFIVLWARCAELHANTKFSPSFHGIRQNTRQQRNAQSEVLFTPRLLADYRVSVFKTTKKLLFKPFYKCFVIPHGFMKLVT